MTFRKKLLTQRGPEIRLEFPIRHHLTPFNTIHMVSRHQTTPFNTSMFFSNFGKNDDFKKKIAKIDDFFFPEFFLGKNAIIKMKKNLG